MPPSRQERRKQRRDQVEMTGEYMLAWMPGAGWSDCRLIDMAHPGLGLELLGPWPAAVGDAIIVRVKALPMEPIMTFNAVIRHQEISESGRLRVGIEAVDSISRGDLINHS